jgi:hypothetical protein
MIYAGGVGREEPHQKGEKRAQCKLSLALPELDEGERNGVEEEHRAYDAADGPSQ